MFGVGRPAEVLGRSQTSFSGLFHSPLRSSGGHFILLARAAWYRLVSGDATEDLADHTNVMNL